MPPVTIRKVETKQDYRAFFEFPWVLYKDDPNWVPPLLSMRHDTFDKTKNPAWEYMEGDYFNAWRGDQLIGTIAAFINHRHNEFHEEHIGWFGAFEVREDAEAALALLTTAADWVKAKGYDLIRGPQTFTTHEETGLLVDGFTRPIILYPYNKPYYEGFVRAAGFESVMDTYAFYINANHARDNQLERLGRVSNSIMKRSHITVRAFDPKRKSQEFDLLKQIYNAAWEKNWGFVPFTPKELDALLHSIGQFFDPRLAFFAFVNDDPAGMVMAIPDFNQVLQKAYPKPGTPEVVSLIKALYYWKVRPVMDWVRVPLLGVKEQYRGKGVDVAMQYAVMDAVIKAGHQHCDSGWVLATNKAATDVTVNAGGGKIYKTYRYFDKTFAPPAEAPASTGS
jgi:GNAT superfamily N-acetyltransferase